MFLLPEIAITTHLIGRLKHYFKGLVAVYHSKFNQNERVEVWQENLASASRFKIFIGARSSIFLPFHNLGLIIVDEEHERMVKHKVWIPVPKVQVPKRAKILTTTWAMKLKASNNRQDRVNTRSLNRYHGIF